MLYTDENYFWGNVNGAHWIEPYTWDVKILKIPSDLSMDTISCQSMYEPIPG